MVMRPVVGVSTSLSTAEWDDWTQEAAIVSTSYVAVVEAAGGLPVLIPTLTQDPYQSVAMIDALILSGGPDLHPGTYGARSHPRVRPAAPERDRWEFALAAAALAVDLPILGVCRGMQLLNVARGGTLIQHLPDEVGHDGHLPDRTGFGRHRLDFAAGSRLAAILGTSVQMATHHHQAVARCGDGVVPVGWAADGTIEAIELTDRTFVVGLQGHPEESADIALFEHLIAVCRDNVRPPL